MLGVGRILACDARLVIRSLLFWQLIKVPQEACNIHWCNILQGNGRGRMTEMFKKEFPAFRAWCNLFRINWGGGNETSMWGRGGQGIAYRPDPAPPPWWPCQILIKAWLKNLFTQFHLSRKRSNISPQALHMLHGYLMHILDGQRTNDKLALESIILEG